MKNFYPGQRWISELELNLGLGSVQKVDNRQVQIYYPAADCLRLYAISSAPLKRVEFKPGDIVLSRDGVTFEILSISVENNTFVYHGKDFILHESQLNDFMEFTSPVDRFTHRVFDDNHVYDLRLRARNFQHQMMQSPVRGFIGPRIDLIPHQLYIASRICSRVIPRALLSDETGLGKTIEACLIVHRLLLQGQINRVLILVPNSLVLQWFVELLRRFNLIFRITDDEFRDSLKTSDYTGNLFLEEQLYLCSIDYLMSDIVLQNFSLSAGWDMLVIDEAHHLLESSPEYTLVKKLGQVSTGMLLLTATPEQFGYQSHFARLHLLDPDRYYNYDAFIKEEDQYADLSVSQVNGSDDLLDVNGPGRVIFQNTRDVIAGFPERIPHLIPLGNDPDSDTCDETLEQLSREFHADQSKETIEYKTIFRNDKRISWLVSLLRELKSEKILLICTSKEKAKAIDESLKSFLRIETAMFHEELSLLQRDQNASRFAHPDGARILICSEIGSEGRNFQFAHHLVLFDLPLNPELLEQRIGRLDRIGQKETIHIHVPFVKGSEYEILARWYHEGLNTFRQNLPGVHGIFQFFQNRLNDIILSKNLSELENILNEASKRCSEIKIKNKDGKHHLLALNSFQPEIAKNIIAQIKNTENNPETENFMMDIFEHYGIEEDLLTDKTFLLNLSLLTTETLPLPVLDKVNLMVTFDRKTAVTYEHIEFLTIDHPLVFKILEYFLASENGNCAIAVLKDSSKKSTILLEAVFLLESPGRPEGFAQIERYLPPTPIRLIINHLRNDCSIEYPEKSSENFFKNTHPPAILGNERFIQEVFPAMLKHCKKEAKKKSNIIKKDALEKSQSELSNELQRLLKLQKFNKDITEAEIAHLADQKEKLAKEITSSRIRLDALRLIFSQDLTQ